MQRPAWTEEEPYLAISEILESPQAVKGENLPKDSLMRHLRPIYESEDFTGKGKGVHGTAIAYECKWPNCEEKPFEQQDRAQEHIAGHLGNELFKCIHWCAESSLLTEHD